MKLKEINDAVAATCNVRISVVTAVQTETFRQMLAAIDKGEKVIVPEFGIFHTKDVPGEGGAPGKKLLRFRRKDGEVAKGKKGKMGKKEGGGGRKKKKAEASGGDDED